MARNTFHVDHRRLREDISRLSDDALFDEYEAACESLNGDDKMTEDMIQDCAMLEGMAIRDRAVQKVAGELLRSRGVIDEFGLRRARDASEPALEPGL